MRIQSGGVRQPAPQPGVAPTDVWEYDASKEGRVCALSGAPLTLWRPQGRGEDRVTISRLNGASETLTWPAGQFVLTWPRAMTLNDGTSYTLASGGGAPPVRLTVSLLPASAAQDPDTLGTALMERGCTRQLDTLIATRVDPTPPDPPEPATRANRNSGR